MPKTTNNLYSDIVSFENIYQAYLECRKGKRYSVQAMEFTMNLEINLLTIHNQLLTKTWIPGKAHCFIVREPKIRQISAPPFSDRVVHHAIMRVCSPLFESRFIANSFACRKYKGAQAAIKTLQKYMRENNATYAIKADVKKCFSSLKHSQLISTIARVISCPDTINLFTIIFAAYGNDCGVGLPIGALTSQWACNLLLDKLDHTMMDQYGFGHYVRYMDDVIIITNSKSEATRGLALLEQALNDLDLELNPKSGILPLRLGVDFVGYRTYTTHILPRKRIIVKARRLLSTLPIKLEQLDSFLAYCKHCNSYRTVSNISYQLY